MKDVEYTETYPYDTATFSQATVERVSETAFGAHGGADVTWLVTREVAVGGSVRYSRANVDLSTPVGGSISLDAGGLQAAVVVKVRVLGKERARYAHHAARTAQRARIRGWPPVTHRNCPQR